MQDSDETFHVILTQLLTRGELNEIAIQIATLNRDLFVAFDPLPAGGYSRLPTR
jgi:hypothetical protein